MIYNLGAHCRQNRTHFRVWAPKVDAVEVVTDDARVFALKRTADGYHQAWLPLQAGALYRYRLNKGDSFPDPASRFQPEGPHGPSQVIDDKSFRWTDGEWRGLSLSSLVLYELHIGTFTREGTFEAAIKKLRHLKDTGVTAVEIMPVAECPGRWNWGYDGVYLFAPSHVYGSPDTLKRFVNEAHRLGIGVVLDVVYNHLGPEGNYLRKFAAEYFSTHVKTDWGDAMNFDGPLSEAVRDFFCQNAAYWISKFHMDGLRLDATQQIFDTSRPHIIADISRVARRAAGHRQIILIAENEPQDTRCLAPASKDGFELDAMWNDDFHHSATVALTNFTEAYYNDYRGSPQELVSSMKYGFLYQGQWYRWQKQNRGVPTHDLIPRAAVCYLQNHDQVGNTLRGDRITRLADRSIIHALIAAMFLSPQTPMLFMGQEFDADTPFPFFCDHPKELSRLVDRGRRDFMSQFPTYARKARLIPRPQAPSTFASAKLNWRFNSLQRRALKFHRDVLKLRRVDRTLSTSDRHDGATLDGKAFVLRRYGQDHDDRLIVTNLGQDLKYSPCNEPLLAPPPDCRWKLIWSSDRVAYGGRNKSKYWNNVNWFLPGASTLVFKPVALR